MTDEELKQLEYLTEKRNRERAEKDPYTGPYSPQEQQAGKCEIANPVAPRRINVIEQLQHERDALLEQLGKVVEQLHRLEEDPMFAKKLDFYKAKYERY